MGEKAGAGFIFHPSASVPSPFACRTGGPREEWTVWGDDPSLHPSALLSPVLSALQSPLSTLITYINVSKKRTLWVGLCVR